VDELDEIGGLLAVDPPLEGDLEDGDARLRRQARRRFRDTAPPQRVGDGGCQRGQLDELAFLQLGVLGDDRRPARDGLARSAPTGPRRQCRR